VAWAREVFVSFQVFGMRGSRYQCSYAALESVGHCWQRR
jgi:hypothetical protein